MRTAAALLRERAQIIRDMVRNREVARASQRITDNAKDEADFRLAEELESAADKLDQE